MNGKRQLPIKVKVDYLPQGQIKEIELIWDRKLMLAISFDDAMLPLENTNTGNAAIDPGEIHGITAFADNGQAIIITSRQLRSDKRLRNKKHASLQNKLSRCKKGSRRWEKYSDVNAVMKNTGIYMVQGIFFPNTCMEKLETWV